MRRAPTRRLNVAAPTSSMRPLGDGRGAVAIEFALILPLLVMLLFGVTTAGISLTHAIGLSNAVRESARFGATAHPGDANLPWGTAQWDTWANDVIARVRGTQFDDGTSASSSDTSICVDMYKVGSGALVGSQHCSQGRAGSPTLDSGSAPTVDSGNITSGTCVVRVWAARKFEINLVVAPVNAGTITRTAVARFDLRRDEECTNATP
jgi:hypothetical protein